MKKYKHIATNEIATEQPPYGQTSKWYNSIKFGIIHSGLIENSKEWEEIKPLSFEIQSFKGSHGHIWNLLPNGKYQQGRNTPSNLEWMLSLCKEKPNQFQIWSVKRLSDNQILTVGDDYSFQGYEVKNGVLSKITIRPYPPFDIRMWADYTVCYSSAYSIDRLSPREKLFTTQDGKNIYPGDTYAFIYNNIISEIKATQGKYTFIENYYWSTKEKAEEYIIYNKPCLSINDVATVYVTANRKTQPMIVHGKKVMKMGKQPEALLNLVKNKLRNGERESDKNV